MDNRAQNPTISLQHDRALDRPGDSYGNFTSPPEEDIAHLSSEKLLVLGGIRPIGTIPMACACHTDKFLSPNRYEPYASTTSYPLHTLHVPPPPKSHRRHPFSSNHMNSIRVETQRDKSHGTVLRYHVYRIHCVLALQVE